MVNPAKLESLGFQGNRGQQDNRANPVREATKEREVIKEPEGSQGNLDSQVKAL